MEEYFFLNKIVWLDFENAPHVWILKELIERLEENGYEVILTARDFSATVKLSEYCGLKPAVIGGKVFAKSSLSKFYQTIRRGFALRNYIKKQKKIPQLTVSHGSRSQAFAAFLLGIKTISLDDYENSFKGFNFFVDYLLTPFPIQKEKWGLHSKKVVHYPGLKEELYLWNNKNYKEDNMAFIDDKKINVLFRPEGRHTHYSSEKSQRLQSKLIELFAHTANLNIILIARGNEQENFIKRVFENKKVNYSIPGKILNGPALISKCDLIIGGGGTMTRESAVLGVPSYSFFGGDLGDVDKYLYKEKKLILLENDNDLLKIKFKKKTNSFVKPISIEAFDFVYSFLFKQLNKEN